MSKHNCCAKCCCQSDVSLGFEILAFPCNQFGGQEPGTNEEIVQFACTRFKAEYPIFDKVHLHTVLISFIFVFSHPKW